jgi:ABC-type multidrug transport system fused ATPase/permease subunit
VAIHGKSGSGKSTLLYLISRQIAPKSGLIEIDGIDIHTIDNNCFYNQIGYISQNNCYFNNTVEYNLKLGKPDAKTEELKYIMSQVELDYINLQTSMNNLSAGEKQRINIARVLFKPVSILFCDEITSSLDNKTTINIQELIFRLFKNSTILWIDHSQCIAKKSDYVLTVDGGQIIEFIKI